MKANVEDINTVKKILHIEIPEAEVTGELEKAYSTLKKNVRLKGFRPGKVPRSIIESRFKKDMQAEVTSQLIQNSYIEALRENELEPLGEPAIDRPDLEKGSPYHYSVTIEVRPTVPDLNLKGFNLKEKVYKVTDEEVEAKLKILQKNQAQLKAIEEDRPVENGDFVQIDYEGFKDGKPFAAVSKTENFVVEVGSGRILKDFDEQLLGMLPNTSKEFLTRFPDDYFNKELAGQEITFNITLKEIKEEILPEIDDEFAKDLGEHETLAELKQTIRTELERRYKTQSGRELRQNVNDMLLEQVDFELPEVLVNHELSALIGEARKALSYRGMSLEDTGQTEEGLSEKYRPIAEKKAREYLILHKVIEQEGIIVTDEILEDAYKKLSESMNQPVDSIKQFHNQYKEAFEVFKQKALEEQAVMTIIKNSTVEKLEVNGGEAQEPKDTTSAT